ncbi:hypothetical protein Zm00014a_034723 [Zea mays]|uniref:Uncharacterized protein n=2 Tax=Zea mays TaxID=4577 RepID=A0A1D6QHL1_MAIZE|nr:hypothetical protein ZEAMMB73_Zm00001d052504 [Zea mays]PWZ25094.1 hypothetical protein Zm00014a_034723 [Zea mays]
MGRGLLRAGGGDGSWMRMSALSMCGMRLLVAMRMGRETGKNGVRVNTIYLVLQAMVMWGNGRRMEFVKDATILQRNFVIDLLSYEDNSCRYCIPANIQQRLINISTKE